MTQLEKLEKTFRQGQRVSEKKAQAMGITRLANRVYELRQSGLPVYNNDGAYQLGIPRRVIAQAYAKEGSALFA